MLYRQSRKELLAFIFTIYTQKYLFKRSMYLDIIKYFYIFNKGDNTLCIFLIKEVK